MLENYRRIKENDIFDQILHDSREKKAFLKAEERKTENLIESSKYQQKIFENSSEQFLIEGFTTTRLGGPTNLPEPKMQS